MINRSFVVQKIRIDSKITQLDKVVTALSQDVQSLSSMLKYWPKNNNGRKVKETTYIKQRAPVVNRDQGYQLPPTATSLFCSYHCTCIMPPVWMKTTFCANDKQSSECANKLCISQFETLHRSDDKLPSWQLLVSCDIDTFQFIAKAGTNAVNNSDVAGASRRFQSPAIWAFV